MHQEHPEAAGTRAALRAALVAYLELLRGERVRFTGGVRSALGALDDDALADAAAFAEAAESWGSGFRGAGTLSDLVLDRDTVEERRTVNEHREQLEDAVQACLVRGLEESRG